MGFRAVCVVVTLGLSAAAACSQQPAGNVSWPGGTFAHEARGCCWEETDRCRATAAPSPSPRCTWQYGCTQCQRYRHQLLDVVLPLGHTVCLKGLLDMVVSQLFEDLTEDLVLERLGLQCSLKDLICELVDRTHPFGWVVAHVLHYRCR